MCKALYLPFKVYVLKLKSLCINVNVVSRFSLPIHRASRLLSKLGQFLILPGGTKPSETVGRSSIVVAREHKLFARCRCVRIAATACWMGRSSAKPMMKTELRRDFWRFSRNRSEVLWNKSKNNTYRPRKGSRMVVFPKTGLETSCQGEPPKGQIALLTTADLRQVHKCLVVIFAVLV